MNNICRAFVLFLAFPLFAIPVLAETRNDRTEMNNAHREWLATGSFGQLDQEQNQIQLEYEKGQWDESELVSLLSTPFLGADPAFEELYNEWVAAYPKSYAAHQARGFYFSRMASRRNQEARIRGDITAEDKAEINRYIDQSVKASTAALSLATKPLTAYATLIQMYGLSGALEESRNMLDAANKVAPDNIYARHQYIKSLEESGASFSKIQQFMKEISESNLTKKALTNINGVFHIRLLKEGQFRQLDKEMNQIQQAYESGKFNDITLYNYFSPFINDDPALEEKYNAWVKAYPRSYAAHQARAMYVFNIAYKARGYQYIRDTTGEEIAGMRFHIERALEDSKAALSLAEKPTLTYRTLLDIGRTNGWPREVLTQLLEKGNEMDPENHVVRSNYMFSSQTRWGGSLETMKNFLEEIKAVDALENQIKIYENMILEEELWLADQIIENLQDISQLQTGL